MDFAVVYCYLVGLHLVWTGLCKQTDEKINVENADIYQQQKPNDLKAEISDLREVVNKLKSYTQLQLKAEISDLRAEVNDLKDSTQLRLKKIDRDFAHVTEQQNFIGFTAFLTADQTYDSGDKVLFDGVVTNYGNSYDKTTGDFMCQVNGYYLFSVNVRDRNDSQFWASLRLDGSDLITIYAHGTEDQGANLVIVQCNQGQTVNLFCTQNGSRLFGSTDRYSTFSGALLELVQ